MSTDNKREIDNLVKKGHQAIKREYENSKEAMAILDEKEKRAEAELLRKIFEMVDDDNRALLLTIIRPALAKMGKRNRKLVLDKYLWINEHNEHNEHKDDKGATNANKAVEPVLAPTPTPTPIPADTPANNQQIGKSKVFKVDLAKACWRPDYVPAV